MYAPVFSARDVCLRSVCKLQAGTKEDLLSVYATQALSCQLLHWQTSRGQARNLVPKVAGQRGELPRVMQA